MELLLGDRVTHSTRPDWGLGQIFELSGNGKVRVYFSCAGRRQIATNVVELLKVDGDKADSELLDTLSDRTWPYARFNIYVIELNEAVWNEHAYRAENPNRDPAKPCLYVGMSWHTPEERFAQHMAGGVLAARYVHRYRQGARLRGDLFQHFNPMHKRLAALMEVERAHQLRGLGFGVWQK
jgi:hypothetical protein